MACNASREHVGYLLWGLVVGSHDREARSEHACVCVLGGEEEGVCVCVCVSV